MAKSKKSGAKAKGVSAKANGDGEATASAAPVYRLVRRNTKTQKVSARTPGRPHPDFEYGHLIGDSDTFHPGNPPESKRKPGRPAGSKSAGMKISAKSAAKNMNVVGFVALKDVDAEVRNRLKNAKAAAMDAFAKALGV